MAKTVKETAQKPVVKVEKKHANGQAKKPALRKMMKFKGAN